MVKMTESDSLLTYDELISLRDRLWQSSISRPGEILRFKDRYVSMPKIENMDVYRGQTKDYGSLKSGLYRDRDPYMQAISLAKQKEFEMSLSDVPAFSRILNQGMPIAAVAQHYGMATEYLDVSGSFAIALFFATCIYDRKKKMYRPLNHREIRDNPYGAIYNTLLPSIPMEDLKVIGFSSLNRPSCQHSILIRDRNDGNLDRLLFKRRFEHSVRLSNEMFRFFNRGRDLFPSNDSNSIEVLAITIRDSKVVNRSCYIQACHGMGLDGSEEELMSFSGDYVFTDKFAKLSPQDMMAFDCDIEYADFIRNSGMQFTSRLSYMGGRE